MTGNYHHSGKTAGTPEGIAKLSGRGARLVLTGVILGPGDTAPGVGTPALFAVDERWGFGNWVIGLDIEALEVDEA